MLSLLSAWTGLLSLVLAIAMVVHRPVLNDLTIVLVLYFGSPGALCFGGLTLWAFRGDQTSDAAIKFWKRQSLTGIILGLTAAGLVYLLIMGAHRVPVH